jgi:O-antigen/teichoic acid export membrane protein
MKVSRDFLVILSGRIGQAVLALVGLKLMTSLLPKTEIGMTYTVASLGSFFGLILINPVGMYFNRHVHLWHRHGRLRKAFHILNIYFLAIALLSVPVVFVSKTFFHFGSELIAWQLVLLLFLNVFGSTWFMTLVPTLNLLEKRQAFVVLNLVSQLIGLLLSIALIRFVETTAFLWLFGGLVGQVIGAIATWFYYRRFVFQNNSNELPNQNEEALLHRHQLMVFILPIAMTTSLMWAQTQLYRLIVETQLGAESLANLGVGLGVAASIMGIMESLVNQWFQPEYYQSLSSRGREGRLHAWIRLNDRASAVYIPTSIYIICSAPFILRILVSRQFADAWSILCLGAGVEFMRVMTSLVYMVSHSEMRTVRTITPYILSAVSALGCIAFVIFSFPTNQLIGISISLLFAGILGFSLMYQKMKALLPIAITWNLVWRMVLLSIPFSAMGFFWSHADSIYISVLVCMIFGFYLLGVIHRGLKSIQN